MWIGQRAFKDCAKLSEITLPDAIRSIEEETFMSCKSLHTVNLTDNVEFVDVRAFRNCPGIDADVVTNPDAEIAPDAFDPKPESVPEEDVARAEFETPATSDPSDAPV